jgi:hypothetical protein
MNALKDSLRATGSDGILYSTAFVGWLLRIGNGPMRA